MPTVLTIYERQDSTDTVDARLIRNVTRNWDMFSTDRMSAVAASVAFSVNQSIYINTVHPDLATCYCSTIAATEDPSATDPHYHYTITATYTNNFDSGGEGTSGGGGSAGGATGGQQQGTAPNERIENPLDRKIDIKFDGQTQQVSLRQDSTGQPYTNTAGDPILPAPQRSVPGVKITIGRNVKLCPGNLFQYLGRINNSDLIIPLNNQPVGVFYPAFGLRFATLSAEPVYESGVSYWRLSMTLEQGPHRLYGPLGRYYGWEVPVASIGRRGRTKANLNIHVITDGELAYSETVAKTGTGQPMPEPVFLSRDGFYVVPGDTGENIWYKIFRPDETFNMAVLWS